MYFSQDKKSSIQGLTIFKKKKKQRKITAAPVFLLVIDITNRRNGIFLKYAQEITRSICFKSETTKSPKGTETMKKGTKNIEKEK